MNIAIFGYYNFFNAGDDRIQHCLKRIFQGHIITFLPHFLPPPDLNYLNTFDWIIIGGGGLVREQVGIWVNMAQWLRNLRANVGVIGLGINSLTSELKIEVFNLLERAKFFFVRDKTSKQLLDNDSRVEVHPDLTWCFPFSDRTTLTGNTIAVNLTPCEGRLNAKQWLGQVDRDRLVPFPLYFTKNRDYVLLKEYFGVRTPQEFTLEPLVNSKILIACRYHALVFAMQLGIPFVAIHYDHKVKRLLVESNLDHLCLELDESNLLADKISYIESHQAEIISTINTYATLQKQLAQTMLQQLNNSIDRTLLVEHPRTIIKKVIKKIIFNS